MVAIAQAEPGCYEARMAGGNFGGCAVAQVAEDQVKNILINVARTYQKETGLEPKIYVSTAASGTGHEDLTN